MRPLMKHIAIKYHHLWIFFKDGDVEIKNIYTKEQIADIFMKPLDSELFIYIRYDLNGWYINGILLHEVVWYFMHEAVILVYLS